jgi:hypothetical protein
MRCVVRGPALEIELLVRYVRAKLSELSEPGRPGALYGVITGLRRLGRTKEEAVVGLELLPSASARVCAELVRATALAALRGLGADRLVIEVGSRS